MTRARLAGPAGGQSSGATREAIGTVRETHRGDLHGVDVELAGETRRVLCRRSGKMDRAHIRLVLGDRVRVELSADLGRGRIVQRFKPGEDEQPRTTP